MNRLGACSWSLRAESPAALAALVNDVGVSSVQLGLDPLVHGAWRLDDVRAAFDARGVHVASGMIGMKGEDYTSLATIRETGGVRPDGHWRANYEAAARAAQLARELGLELVTFHAGFLPHDARDCERTKLVGRLRELADLFDAEGVRLGLETGQETAATLAGVLDELDRANVGVNFDPANMILYGMGDPVDALRTLAPRVFQVHVKDAVAATTPGAWGAEVPVGTGQVDWAAFFGVLADAGLACDLMIEREAGDDRVADMRTARALVLGLRGEVLR